MKTFKILGLLLTYPQGPLHNASAEMIGVLDKERLLPGASLKALSHFLQERRRKDLMELQEQYVETFDRGRAHCLHLFEHVHGESRDRGQAMIDLSEAYASKGLYINANELPDYLPLFMEYLSYCPFAEARGFLGEAIDVIAMIGTRLRKRRSSYAVVFDAVEALSTVKADQTKVKNALKGAPKDPETLEELDEEWREAEAFNTGADAAATSCGHCTATVNGSSAQPLVDNDGRR